MTLYMLDTNAASAVLRGTARLDAKVLWFDPAQWTACEALRRSSLLRRRPLRYSFRVAPTIVRDGQFRLFFFSREETRIHVHAAHPDGEVKFWLTPTVHLATNIGLSPKQIRQAQAVVEAHLQEIEDAWRRHFGR